MTASMHAPGFDPDRPCRYCTRPVRALSTGGPDVCSACEVHGVPPEIYAGRAPARDFHAEREAGGTHNLRWLQPWQRLIGGPVLAAGLPSEAALAVCRALLDVFLSMPSLPPALIVDLRQLRDELGKSAPDAGRALLMARDISRMCCEAQARQGR